MRAKTVYAGTTIPTTPISFETKEKQQVLVVSGSMFFDGTDGAAVVDIFVNTDNKGSISIYQNGAGRHLAFPTMFIPLSLVATSPGNSHILLFQPRAGAKSDANDTFNVCLIE